ncbi:MAG: class E sortase [Ilumatobacter sp.]|uniref:class E sortase n=1 Tax=Ilumatobacter sp. TaxID=1967498 RepID=UPI00391D5C96
MSKLRTKTEPTGSSAASTTSTRLRIGLAAAAGVLALGGVAWSLQPSGDRVASTDAAVSATTTSTPPTTEPIDDPTLFSEATVTSSALPTTTAPATTTTTTTAPAPTTAPATVAETLPAQPPEPIAPPPDPRGFEEQIRLGDIAIPKLGVAEPLLSGIRLTTLDNGPGHWPGTAMPGQIGNVVVAAHRTSHGGPFRNIDQLVAGDVVEFTIDGDVIEYIVTGTEIVNPDAIWIVDQTDTPTATLFACHPPGSVAQRIVVHLELSV